MRWKLRLQSPGILATLSAAVLFGCGAPVAKLLLANVSPWLMAGLLYLGSGLGLFLYRSLVRAPRIRLSSNEVGWFIGAISVGGVVAPVLLMTGLRNMPASAASLLLNAEGVFTALLAWFAFEENFDARIALGMVAIVCGAIILSWPSAATLAGFWPALTVLGACFAWAIDNNLTRKISLADATWVASVKGLVAGLTNLVLALTQGIGLPRWPYVAAAMLIGFLAYGVSLALFVVGLRHLGTARTSAYFSVAPFAGALFALLMGDPVTLKLIAAGALMMAGVVLHLSEQHEHEHTHEALEHEHEHEHDEHHHHAHEQPIAQGMRHRHKHRHDAIVHSHAHFPDAHHRHGH